jgi:hypothetical protein
MLCALVLPRPTWAVWSVVQSGANGTSSGSSIAKAFTSNTTAGNPIFVAVGSFGNATGFVGDPTDTAGNTYTGTKCLNVGSALNGNNNNVACWFVPSGAGGADTVTFAGCNQAGQTNCYMVIAELTGKPTNYWVIGISNISAPNGAANTLYALNASQSVGTLNDFLALNVEFNQTSNVTYTASAGWTVQQTFSVAADSTITLVTRDITAAGDFSNTLVPSNTATNRHGFMVILAPAGGGGSTVHNSAFVN